MIQPDKLQAVIRVVMPACKDPALWTQHLGNAMTRSFIDTPERMDDFLAQIAVESGEMNHTAENLNYTADRLMVVWPKRFPTAIEAILCANNPRALANTVYGGRMGNTLPDDGWKYRGRGLIQITGKAQYVVMAGLLGLPSLVDAPDWLETPRLAAMSAAAYWANRHLNELADAGNDAADFITITKAINGGTEGLNKRQLYWTRARTALGLARVA